MCLGHHSRYVWRLDVPASCKDAWICAYMEFEGLVSVDLRRLELVTSATCSNTSIVMRRYCMYTYTISAHIVSAWFLSTVAGLRSRYVWLLETCKDGKIWDYQVLDNAHVSVISIDSDPFGVPYFKLDISRNRHLSWRFIRFFVPKTNKWRCYIYANINFIQLHTC